MIESDDLGSMIEQYISCKDGEGQVRVHAQDLRRIKRAIYAARTPWKLVRLEKDWAWEAYLSDGLREVCGKGPDIQRAVNDALEQRYAIDAAEKSRE